MHQSSPALLLNMDCVEYMKTCPDKHFDLAIVDPPYGINAPNMTMGSNPSRKGRDEKGEMQYGAVSVAQKLKKGRLNLGSGKLKNRNLNTMNCDWDTVKPTQEYFDELFRVSKNQIIWGGNYFPLPPTRGIICWNKNQPWDNFSQFELAWTSFDCPARLFTHSNRGGGQMKKPKSILRRNPFTFIIFALNILPNPVLKFLIHIWVQAHLPYQLITMIVCLPALRLTKNILML